VVTIPAKNGTVAKSRVWLNCTVLEKFCSNFFRRHSATQYWQLWCAI